MPTIGTPRSARSRPSSASPAATCLTYGQWLQMKVTTSAGPARSSRLTVAPVAGSGSEKDGAGVPRASMVDSMAMAARLALDLGAEARDQVDRDRQHHRAQQVGQQSVAQHRRPDRRQPDLG